MSLWLRITRNRIKNPTAELNKKVEIFVKTFVEACSSLYNDFQLIDSYHVYCWATGKYSLAQLSITVFLSRLSLHADTFLWSCLRTDWTAAVLTSYRWLELQSLVCGLCIRFDSMHYYPLVLLCSLSMLKSSFFSVCIDSPLAFFNTDLFLHSVIPIHLFDRSHSSHCVWPINCFTKTMVLISLISWLSFLQFKSNHQQLRLFERMPPTNLIRTNQRISQTI